MKIHLDGARLWHVASITATPMKKLCDPFDSVSLCFSKGLGKSKTRTHHIFIRAKTPCAGAPVGSMLVGKKDFIAKARWFRKLFGGGMRQTGVISACAAYALTNNFLQLPRVHALAQRLESGLRKLGAEITSRAETCMVGLPPAHLSY
jgi:threonine aldolase